MDPQSRSGGFTSEQSLVPAGGKKTRSLGRSMYILVHTIIELIRLLPNDKNFRKLRYCFVAPELSTSCLVNKQFISCESVYWLRRIWGTAFKGKVQSLHFI